MKKSSQVPATLIVAIAASLGTNACSSQRCVDALGRPLPEYDCSSGTGYMRGHYIRTGGFGGFGGSGGSFGG